MAWTDERIDTLRKMWEGGQTASQIAEVLGGVSRNAVIGKAHRLGLQSRPSPVKPNDPDTKAAVAAAPAESKPAPAKMPERVAAPAPAAAPIVAKEVVEADDEDEDDDIEADVDVVAAPPAPPPPIMRSVGPGGFLRQAPGEQQAPITPAPPRRLVPAKPSADMAGKTTLLDLNDKICKWPLGHPGEPDFHFCGDKVNPGFPYCVAHCGHAYQAQLPRRDRRPPPPLPFGGPRVR
jgi:GcrA cell cycle regulator